MKKLIVLFVLLISSVFLFSFCGTSPDQTEDEIMVFFKGKGYNDVVEIIVVKSEIFSLTSPFITAKEDTKRIKMRFDYIVLAKKNNQNSLLFLQSEGSFPKIVYEIPVPNIDTVKITKK